MWVAWMNLENLYGSQQLLLKVFDSALEQNEPVKVYKKLVTIYVQSDKQDLADKLYQIMTKKFGNNLWVWSDYGTFLMKQQRHIQARALLQRALKTLTLKRDRTSYDTNACLKRSMHVFYQKVAYSGKSVKEI